MESEVPDCTIEDGIGPVHSGHPLSVRVLVCSLTVLVLIVLVFAHQPMRVGAVSPGATITVGNSSDTSNDDQSLSLREAVSLATANGSSLGGLDQGECNSISDGHWNAGLMQCECPVATCHHGAAYSDHIVFAPGTFVLAPSAVFILSTGNDSIRGEDRVTINGPDRSSVNCLNITSNGNLVSGIRLRDCETAISVRLGQDNIIGEPTSTGDVIIEDTSYAGVELYHGDHSTVRNTIISGSNFTGIWGILVNSSNNTIGSTDLAYHNQIYQEGIGIFIAADPDNPASGNTVIGSCIGLAFCTTTASNGQGVRIENAANNAIGGTTAAEANYIAGNAANGVTITGAGAQGNVVEGNFIGNDGTNARPNGTGIEVVSGASGNTIGRSTAGARNVISGNNGDGVLLDGAGSGNVVQGNYIGTNAAGMGPVANANGVVVRDSNGTTIGGTTAGGRNVISGNTGEGVLITGTSHLNVVEGNYVGVDHFGNGAAGMGNLDGVVIYGGAWNNTIGGGTDGTSPGSSCTGACNVISGNSAGGSGVASSAGANENGIFGNYIGTNAGGNVAVANGAGIQIIDSPGNGIGRNVISGNLGGIIVGTVAGTAPSGTTIYSNYIGVGANGTSPLGNTLGGIAMLASTNASIGGVIPETANIIAYNGGPGIQVSSGTNNQVYENAIFSNAQRGINLQPNPSDPTKPNDPKDPDTGPNNYQNFPVLTSAVTASGSTEVTGTLNTTPNTDVTIEVFSNPACDSPGPAGEGETFLGRTDIETFLKTDVNGNVSFDLTGLPAVPVGQVVTATATTADGTSEFSACTTVTEGTPPATTPAATTPAATTPAATSTATPTPTPSGTPVPTATVPAITLKGDANCNGLVNLSDIKTMLAEYAGVPEQLNALCHPDLDLNCDHTADVGDIIPFLWTQANLVPTLQPGCKPIGTQLG